MCTNFKSLYSIPESNRILYVNDTSVKQFKILKYKNQSIKK